MDGEGFKALKTTRPIAKGVERGGDRVRTAENGFQCFPSVTKCLWFRYVCRKLTSCQKTFVNGTSSSAVTERPRCRVCQFWPKYKWQSFGGFGHC